jgi:hypothetical protein
MTDQVILTSAEKIYAVLEDIRKRAEIIRDCHAARAFAVPSPPPVGHSCIVPDKREIMPAEVYDALLDLEQRVGNIAKEYAAHYDLGPKQPD